MHKSFSPQNYHKLSSCWVRVARCK